MLIVTRDESPLVYRAPESASEHSHFGPLRNIVISGHVISGQARSVLHNCTISSYYVQAVGTESRYKRQFGSNSLLFTSFKTV